MGQLTGLTTGQQIRRACYSVAHPVRLTVAHPIYEMLLESGKGL